MAKSDVLFGSHPLPALSRAVFALGRVVLSWKTRRATRRDLLALDLHLLRDVGLSSEAARAECDKPFWKD